jgi:hypothetical protein
MSIFTLGLAVLLGGTLIALGYAALRTYWIFRQPVENPTLKRIAGYVAEGAMAFLKKEYQTLIPFVLIVAILLFVANLSRSLEWTAASFLLGAVTSAISGYIGDEGRHRCQLQDHPRRPKRRESSPKGFLCRRNRHGNERGWFGHGRHPGGHLFAAAGAKPYSPN